MSVPQPPFKVKTKVSWAGEEDGDLGFLENEIIEVYSIVDESWWSGKLRRNRAEGIFPKDYVEVIPELNKSVSSHSIGTPKAQTPVQTPIQTPVKEADYGKFKHSRASGTPTGMYNSYNGSKSVSPKRYHHVNVDADGSFEVEDAVNCTYDGIYDSSNGMSSSNRSSPKKIRSANKLVSSTQHPRYRNSHNGYQQQQHEDFDREREMENFRTLQQQQNYHIKKSPSHNMKSSVQTQQQEFRQSSYSPENSNSIYGKHQGKSNSRSGSQQNLSQSAVQGHSPQVKSQSYVDIPYRNQQNNTVESFVSEGSPSRQTRRARYDADAVNEYEIISQKRAQLELELSQLKQLERSTQKKRVHNPHLQHKSGQVSRGSNDDSLVNSLESSYISEDLLSSKKNYSSREDLGKKLAKFESVDDEDDDYFNDNESSPPPPPPKHTTPIKAIEAIRDNDSPLRKSGNKIPFDADDFRFSGSNRLHQGQVSEEDVYRVSQLQQDDLKNSIKSLQSDVLNLSELSATSAGSFMRHKYERDIQQQEMKLHSLSINEEEEKRSPKQNGKDVMDSVFQEKKSRHPNIFKMLLSKKSDNEINVIERKLQKDEEIDWTTFKMDLNRMNSLTSHDKQSRTRRVVREEGSLIVKPLDYISEINCNEVVGDNKEEDSANEDLNLTEIAKRKVSHFMENYETGSDLNDLISDVSVKFNNSKVSQIRCVLVHLCKFRIIEESSKILTTKPKLNEVLHLGEASVYQLCYLLKKILDALRIPAEVVLGFWKKPNEFYHNEQYVINHSWLSILLDSKFYILDLYNFKNGSVCNIRENAEGFNEFYFLARPLSVVSTHIPSVIDLQHVLPPIDPSIAFYLPRAYSGFYRSGLKFRNFNNALTRLRDLEFFELELNIPVDVELFTLVKTSKVTTNELSLCQIQWNNNKKIAKIKAILPEGESIGVLQIFAGPKGLQKHFDNIHELAVVIPLYHTGDYKPSKFIPRFPTVQSQNNDLYVRQPQTNKIIVKNAYNFEIDSYPSTGLNSGSGLMNQDFKIVIESPSGKYFKMTKDDPSKPFGTFAANIKCTELGLYRGLVIGDSGNSWYVFTQWESVPGTVTN